MYLDFYGLNREPFHITPDPEFLYLSPSHKEAFATILYGVDKRKGFIAVTGEVGTGKTTILRAYMEQLSSTTIRPIYLFDPAVSFEELLEAMLNELGMRAAKRSEFAKLQWLRWYLIQEFKQDHNVALLVDEAQNMPTETMERLRILSNVETTKEKLIQIVLVGQPELEAKLRHPSLRQLNERIAVRAAIRPLSREESVEYVTHRLTQAGGNPEVILSPGAFKKIVKHAEGIPRRLNILCDNALVAGFGAHRRPVPGSVVDEVIADLKGHKRVPGLRKALPVAAGLLVTAVIGIGAYTSLNVEGRSVADQAVTPMAVSEPPAAESVRSEPEMAKTPSAAIPPAANPAETPTEAVPAEPETVPSEQAVPETAVSAQEAAAPAVSDTAAAETPTGTPVVEPPAPVAVEPVAEKAVEAPAESAKEEPAEAAAAEPSKKEEALASAPGVSETKSEQAVEEAASAESAESSGKPEKAEAAEPGKQPAAVAQKPEEPAPPLVLRAEKKAVREVAKGDSLNELLRSVYGVSNRKLLDEVVKYNPRIQNPDLIYYGDKIVFPALEPSAAGDGAEKAAPAEQADSQRSEP